MVLRATVGTPQIFSPPPFHMWCCNSCCFYFVLSLDSSDMYQLVLVQPIISLVFLVCGGLPRTQLGIWNIIIREVRWPQRPKHMTRSDVYSYTITSVVFRTRI